MSSRSRAGRIRLAGVSRLRAMNASRSRCQRSRAKSTKRRYPAASFGPHSLAISSAMRTGSAITSSVDPSGKYARYAGSRRVSVSQSARSSPTAASGSATRSGTVSTVGPVSNSYPRTDRRPARPPGTASRSRIVTSRPDPARCSAQASPPSPAPTTTTRSVRPVTIRIPASLALRGPSLCRCRRGRPLGPGSLMDDR